MGDLSADKGGAGVNWRTTVAGVAAAVSLLIDNHVATDSPALEGAILAVRCLAVGILGLAAVDRNGRTWRTGIAGILGAIALFFDRRVATGMPVFEGAVMLARAGVWVSLGVLTRDRAAPWRSTIFGIAAGVGLMVHHHVPTGVPGLERLVDVVRASSMLAIGWCAKDRMASQKAPADAAT